MEFRKKVTITLYARQQRHTDVLNSLLDSVGEGKGGMIWENGFETCEISHVKQIASPGLMHETDQSILKEISPEYSLEGLML